MLDFPRNIRERLILRVIEEWGWDRAALAGMIPSYTARGVVRDLGSALGLPPEEAVALARSLETDSSAELSASPTLPARYDRPGGGTCWPCRDSWPAFPRGRPSTPAESWLRPLPSPTGSGVI